MWEGDFSCGERGSLPHPQITRKICAMPQRNGEAEYLAKMNSWDTILKDTLASIHDLSRVKGGEYAGDDDRLANFRRNARHLGTTMEMIWAVYAAKHFDAILQYVSDISHGKERERSEPIPSRVDDLIVYLLLFKLIFQERQAG